MQQTLICPRCGSDKVSVQFIQTNAKTKSKGTGCLWSIGRAFLIVITFGLWLLVGRRKGGSKTAFRNEKHGICANCGYDWIIEETGGGKK